MKNLLLIILVILTSSCSPQYYALKAERQVARHEALLKRIEADTLAPRYINSTPYYYGPYIYNQYSYGHFYRSYTPRIIYRPKRKRAHRVLPRVAPRVRPKVRTRPTPRVRPGRRVIRNIPKGDKQ